MTLAPEFSGAPTESEAEVAPSEVSAVSSREATRREKLSERAATVLGHARGVAGRIGEVVQPLGWVLIATGIVLWVVGLRFGWIELVIAAGAITALVLVSLLFLIGRTAYAVELDLNRTHVVVGERAVGSLILTNPTSRALMPSRVILPVGAGRGVFDIPRLAAGDSHEELFAIPTSSRGVLQIGPVSVQRGDPLGLFERAHDRQDAVELHVHPQTTSLSGLSLGHVRDLEGLPAQHLARDDVSFHALREYQPGDDLRHVHWKSTARVGEMMIREYEQTRRSHFVVGLSTHPGEYRTPEEFELAISAAGSIGLRALRDSRTLDVRVQKGALRARTGPRFLDELSELEASKPREGGIVALAGTLAAHAPLAAVAVLVTGSKTDSAALRRACARLPLGVKTLAIVADTRITDAPELRRIGDADVLSIASLDHLARGIGKVLS